MAITKIGTPELFDFSSLNTALQLPTGNTASRPSGPSTGEWRFNTDLKYVEYYDSGTWRQIDTEAQTPDPITTDLVLSWDTTQTDGAGSTGDLLALNGTSVTSQNSSFVVKTGAAYQDPSGNQGWFFPVDNTNISNQGNIYSNVNMNDSTFMNTTNTNWSLEVWCRIDGKNTDSSGSGGAVWANSWQAGGAGVENFILGLYGVSSTSTAGGFHSLVRTGGGTTYLNIGPASGPNYGNWSQVVWVADGANSDVEVYVNGASLGSPNPISIPAGTPQTSAYPLYIGNRIGDPSYRSWNGIFRICRMYKTALTAANVLNNFDANKATFGL